MAASPGFQAQKLEKRNIGLPCILAFREVPYEEKYFRKYYLVRLISAILISTMFMGCAVLISGSKYKIHIQSNPSDADVEVKQQTLNLPPLKGKTPYGYEADMRYEYQMSVSKAGYKTQTWTLVKKINYWTLGNLIVGWVGFIADGYTGATKIPEKTDFQVDLVQGVGSNEIYTRVVWLDGSNTRTAYARLEPGSGHQIVDFNERAK